MNDEEICLMEPRLLKEVEENRFAVGPDTHDGTTTSLLFCILSRLERIAITVETLRVLPVSRPVPEPNSPSSLLYER